MINRVFERVALCAGILATSAWLFGQPVSAEQKLVQAQTIVDCSTDSLQAAIDAVNVGVPTIITVEGDCTEDVTITKDDLMIQGDATAGGTVDGTITIIGARRVTITNMIVTGPGFGIFATDNATVMVDDSDIVENHVDGILVENGAHANIIGSIISRNGQNAPPNFGLGVNVNDSGTARITKSTIADNLADGIGVFNDGFARVEENTIVRNGLTGSSCGSGGCGVQVSRARVRANGNIIRNNGYAAIGLYNQGVYRTGSYLSDELGNPDNQFPFEVIVQGPLGDVAVEVGRNSLLDLRQVKIHGFVNTFSNGYLQVRGDDVGPDLECSVIVGDVNVAGNFTVVHLRAVKVVGNIILAGGVLEGDGDCPPF